jgi:hypothetical protein
MMKPSTEKVVDIDVLFASKGLSLPDLTLIKSSLEVRVSNLIVDLGLLVRPNITLELRPDDEFKYAPETMVHIDSYPCRQQIDLLPQNTTFDVNALLNRISKTIYLNRERLLCEPLTSHISELSKEQGSRVVSFLKRRGCSLKFAKKLIDSVDLELCKESLEYALELALANSLPRHVTIELGTHLYEVVRLNPKNFGDMLGMMRDGLFYELGVKFPGFLLSHGGGLGARDFRLHIGGVRGPVFTTLGDDEFLVNQTPTGLWNDLNIVSKDAYNPANGSPSAIVVGKAFADKCEQAGLTTWDTIGFLVLIMAVELRTHADIFLTITEMEHTLSRLREAFPLPIVNLIERFSPVQIVGVLRALVREYFSIRDLRSVMEAMLEINGQIIGIPDRLLVITPPAARLSRFLVPPGEELCPEDYAEYVRMAMKRSLTQKISESGKLNVIETTGSTETRMRNNAGVWSSEEHSTFINAVENAIKQSNHLDSIPILTTYDLRRSLREAIAIEFPQVSVISRQEVYDSGQIRICASIEWN